MPLGGFGIDPRISAAAPRAPAASREYYRPQAILKFHILILMPTIPLEMDGVQLCLEKWYFWLTLWGTQFVIPLFLKNLRQTENLQSRC